MHLPSIRPLLPVISALTLTTAMADLQVGVGAGAYTGSEYDKETGYGLEAEIGFLNQNAPINLFLGVRAAYVDGLAADGSLFQSDSDTDLDLFEGALVARLLVPLGTDLIKIYGEGSLGSANLGVSGKAKVRTEIDGQDFSINSHFDEADWVLAWGLGAGVQFDFTRNIGLRVGYNFHSFGDSDIFGLKVDSGTVHGLTSALVLKF